MILKMEYRTDLVDFIRETPKEVFDQVNRSKTNILNDGDVMESLWVNYQKSVEEYGVDPEYAFRDALHEVLGIPMPKAATEKYRDALGILESMAVDLTGLASAAAGVQAEYYRKQIEAINTAQEVLRKAIQA